LESLKPVFQQDLNGDGVISVPKAVIAPAGSTGLPALGSLEPVFQEVPGGAGDPLARRVGERSP
jgi:hypothetical protein